MLCCDALELAQAIRHRDIFRDLQGIWRHTFYLKCVLPS